MPALSEKESSAPGGDTTDCIRGADEGRLVLVNAVQLMHFCNNRISTAKYGVLSFLPIFLYEQFRRYSNCFFLLIVLLQQIPDVSPTGRYTTMVPFVFILMVSAVKEIVEDYKRHRADNDVNHSLVETLKGDVWRRVKWKDLGVGEIVRVHNNTFFPADLLLLSSSEPQAMCYIETMNLDGETNLKIRQALPETAHLMQLEDLHKYRGVVRCEHPNKLIYNFSGTLSVADSIYPLGPHRILLRGATLRNTSWIIGSVIYTGHDTKLMKNATSAPLKRSTVDTQTNTQVIMLFALLLILCLVSAAFSVLWNARHRTDWYLKEMLNVENSGEFLYTFLTFLILYNNLIPISLQVTVEIVRFFQASFINNDLDMYHEESNTPAVARTSNLNEELGAVKYIFSDKTGTLTRNVMEFKHCSVAGIVYKEEDGADPLLGNAKKQEVRSFLQALTICHTVIPETAESGEILYHASSPDERALLQGARRYGYSFVARTPHFVEITTPMKEAYEILNILDFTSARKRMSVIVRMPEDGSIVLFCKGADNVIFKRLSQRGDAFRQATLDHLQHFANEGLRTLCFAMVEIPKDRYEKWSLAYKEASTVIRNREEKLEEVAELIEKDMTLLGATAVEDKLQDRVPETISALLKAGINVWVLTGDKQETAINIGYSTKLIGLDTKLIVVNEDSLDNLRAAIATHNYDLSASEGKSAEVHVALVVDGQSLAYALTPTLSGDFLTLCSACHSVICCRVTPMQKAEIVQLVRENTREVTLAIGDGANDVAMIQKAHIGIGISGVEGLQAASASDYSIAQFRFLLKLLFVHGSWNHSRMCKLILYSFYKNICLYVMELWFAIYSGWSGQVLFERWTIGLYNVLFTALPPLAIGIVDKSMSAETMMMYPKLYGRTHAFGVKIFWIWIGNALFHSIVLFWLPLLFVEKDVVWESGREDGYLMLGNMVYTYVVLTVCLKAGLHIKSWTHLTQITIWGSLALWFIILIAYSHFWPDIPFGVDMLGMDVMTLSSVIFWLGFILCPVAAMVGDLSVLVAKNVFFKSLAESIREAEIRREDTTQVLERGSGVTERSSLLRNVRNVFAARSNSAPTHSDDMEMNHRGFAFSQEEGGAVSQSDIVRSYESSAGKKSI